MPVNGLTISYEPKHPGSVHVLERQLAPFRRVGRGRAAQVGDQRLDDEDAAIG
jgi:hypothetical protein